MPDSVPDHRAASAPRTRASARPRTQGDTGSEPASRGNYHHGNLRRALMDAAWELASEGGIDAVTLRAVARRAGVSHAAPHHHFPDKGSLVDALTIEGFEQFAAALQDAWDQTDADPGQRLGATGQAYVRFATENREKFRLMNRPELRRTGDPSDSAVGQAAHQAYLVLERAIHECQLSDAIPAGDPAPWAFFAWAGVHGLAMILIDELIPPPTSPADLDQLTASVLESMRHGLAVRPGEPQP